MKRLILALTLAAASATTSVAQSQSDFRAFGCGNHDLQAALAAAKAGDRVAMLCVGVKYANGRQAPKDDVQSAAWYRKAAEAGEARGMLFTGVAYWSGRGVTQDMVEAYKWIILAEKYGCTDASRSVESLARVMSSQKMNEAKTRASEWDAAFQKRQKS